MSNKTSADIPSEGSVDRALMEYFLALERDGWADPAKYRSRLAKEKQRQRFDRRLAPEPPIGLPPMVDVGSRLGRYRLTGNIAKTEMGQVFVAMDERLGRKVAIKVLSAELANTKFRSRIELEAQILAQLEHPSIVRVQDTGQQGNIAYLVMEYIEGVPLHSILQTLKVNGFVSKQGELETSLGLPALKAVDSLIDGSWYSTAARIILDIVRAIEAAHSKSVLHRDLKPHNVILRAGGHPVVLDFGLASFGSRKSGSVTQGFFGSPKYLAPEQLLHGRTGADPATDIYQLGLILYELLTFQSAYPDVPFAELSLRIRRGEFKWPRQRVRSVPRDLEAICVKAMESNPRHRYDGANAMAEDLSRYLKGLPIVARKPSVVRRLAMLTRRRPAVVTSTLAGVLLASSTYLLWGGGGDLALAPVAWRNPQAVSALERNPARPLVPGDVVGFEMQLPEARSVRTLYVSRSFDGSIEFVSPASVCTADDDASLEELSARQFAAGNHTCLSATVDDVPSANRWTAELWVFLGSSQEDLELPFFDQLETLYEDYGREPIPYDQARSLLTELGRGALQDLQDSVQKKLPQVLTADVLEYEKWPIPDQHVEKLRFPVLRSK